ncbi:MucR family transcriptional regulator [Methylobacterium radiotolerans]|uniref:Transcriptional regulator, MucR family n=1 Tax=Methylobacterium radiotolerans (strain ATCC 27329 / DSM 1819 / JCM 2831 / NBRC 15690 / NCIMB 10815 / 0-1) TaxID=426355 RepID=B1MA07_METRJ|nr:MucR family transcriptional regulator [Methylobacterium radiotolerans]ACB28344.1 transcriptional regulator, MucR family [Methylobacterium radiotolerans JCM 2831]GEN01853.1 transcriptional regulator [Methylobacterium radiotolerans]
MNGSYAGSSHVDCNTLTTRVIAAFVSHNHVAASDVPSLIALTHAAIASLQTAGSSTAPGTVKATPAQIRASITYEALISFEDGKRYKTLKRHLTACGLTPETYRAKWGLPNDYPLVAPGYAEKRSRIAKSLVMPRYQRDPAPEAEAA